MLKLNLQYFGDVKSRLTGKDPDAWKYWGQEEKGVTEYKMVDGIIDSMDMSLSKLQGMPKDEEPGMLLPMVLQRVGHDRATEQQQ